MALCKSFLDLPLNEQIIFTGELIHAALNNEKCFEIAQGLIKLGYIDGAFKGVLINPPQPPDKNEEKY